MPTSNTFVTITGLDELNAVFASLPTQLNTIFHMAGKEFTQLVYQDSQKVVPVRTGRLKRSGGTASTQTSEDVFYDAPYANIVEKRRNYFYQYGRAREKQIDTAFMNALSAYLKSRLRNR